MCGGTVQYPFFMNSDKHVGTNYDCFTSCVNLKFEEGPFLTDLGPIPETAIPKKFIWSLGDELADAAE